MARSGPSSSATSLAAVRFIVASCAVRAPRRYSTSGCWLSQSLRLGLTFLQRVDRRIHPLALVAQLRADRGGELFKLRCRDLRPWPAVRCLLEAGAARAN